MEGSSCFTIFLKSKEPPLLKESLVLGFRVEVRGHNQRITNLRVKGICIYIYPTLTCQLSFQLPKKRLLPENGF